MSREDERTHPNLIRLFTVIGRKSDNGYNRHLLRQYMLVLRVMLLANKAPVVIATVASLALCGSSIRRKAARHHEGGEREGEDRAQKMAQRSGLTSKQPRQGGGKRRR